VDKEKVFAIYNHYLMALSDEEEPTLLANALYSQEKEGAHFYILRSSRKLARTLLSKGFTKLSHLEFLDAMAKIWLPQFARYLSTPVPISAEIEKKKARAKR